MGMTKIRHVVRQGETLRSIAFRFGLLPTVLATESPNDELLTLRKHAPDDEVADVPLLPGDLLSVTLPAEPATSISVSASNDFQAEVPLEDLRLCFYDDDGLWANEPYLITGLSSPLPGTTDGDGKIELSVPVTTVALSVHFEQRGITVRHDLRHINPLTEWSGIKQRLALLGFYSGPFDKEDHDGVVAALRAFQYGQDLEPTGEKDDDTLALLETCYRQYQPPQDAGEDGS